MVLLLCPSPAGGGWLLFAVGCQANCCFNLPRALKRINLVHLLNKTQLFVCRRRRVSWCAGTERWWGPAFPQPCVVAGEQSSVSAARAAGERGCAGGCPHLVPLRHLFEARSLLVSPPSASLHPGGDGAPRCHSSVRRHPADAPGDFALRAMLRI